MENSPGRGGAVTGGTFDQSKAPEAGCLLAASVVFPAGTVWVVGATVVLPAGGDSAAKPLSAMARVPTPMQKLKTDFTDFAEFVDGRMVVAVVIVLGPLLLESWR